MKKTIQKTLILLLGMSASLFAQDVVLTVDLDSNSFSLSNEDLVNSAIFDGYRIQSAQGIIDPANWLSLEDQFIAGWNEVGINNSMSIAETRRDGLENLQNGVAIGLGNPLNTGPALASVPFGVDVLDLSVQTFDSSSGALTPGRVVYVGEPEFNNLVLNVNSATGNITLENESPNSVSISAYGIFSTAGSLDSGGYNGLRDTESGWNEIGTTSGFQLGETNPLGDLLVSSGATFDLGSAFSIGGVEDLSFEFLISGAAAGFAGEIKYVGTSGVSGDFDMNGVYDCDDVNALTTEISQNGNGASFDLTSDGVVDGDDLSSWLAEAGAVNNANGGAYLVGDANLDGSVDVSDFNLWNGIKFTTNSNWCDGDFNADGVADVSDFNLWNGNKFQSSDTHAVPEPSAIMLPGLMGVFVLAASRNRRRSR